eukprot:gene24612-10231_t
MASEQLPILGRYERMAERMATEQLPISGRCQHIATEQLPISGKQAMVDLYRHHVPLTSSAQASVLPPHAPRLSAWELGDCQPGSWETVSLGAGSPGLRPSTSCSQTVSLGAGRLSAWELGAQAFVLPSHAPRLSVQSLYDASLSVSVLGGTHA